MSEPIIQTPPGVKQSMANGPMIFAMPEAYRHGGSGAKMVEPTKQVSVPSAPVPVAPVVRPPSVTHQKDSLHRQSSKLWLVIGLSIVVVGLGVSSYLFLRKPSSEIKPEVPVATRPAPRPTERPAPVVATEPTPVVEEPVEPFPKTVVPGVDSDSDGLSDLEEKLIYKTDPRLPDTDSDGFLDGNEVFHRYNPGGTAPGTLLESGLVKEEVTEVYRILYPSVWTSGNIFGATTGEMIAVDVQAHEGKTFDEWFQAQSFAHTFDTSRTKNGYVSHGQDDGLVAIVEIGGDRIMTLRYDTGVKGTVDYLQTFKMMLNSIEAVSTTP